MRQPPRRRVCFVATLFRLGWRERRELVPAYLALLARWRAGEFLKLA